MKTIASGQSVQISVSTAVSVIICMKMHDLALVLIDTFNRKRCFFKNNTAISSDPLLS